MEICNIPDSFFRSIEKIELYSASEYSFNQSFLRETIRVEPLLIFKNILPEEFDRNIKRKSKNGNYYFDIDISFSLHQCDALSIIAYKEFLNKRDFVAVLYSHTDVVFLGNETEPLSVETHEKIKDDNSGTDKIEIQIFGESIIEPQAISL